MSARQSTELPFLPSQGVVTTRLLPPLLRRLMAVIGEALAYRLAEALGGTVIHVPTRVTPNCVHHPVFAIIGAEAFARWVEEWGGDRMLVPKADSVLIQLRHRRVCELAHEARMTGRGLSSVALATGYSIRQVFNILSDAAEAQAEVERHAEYQWDLFADALVGLGATPEPEPKVATGPTAHDPFGLTRPV